MPLSVQTREDAEWRISAVGESRLALLPWGADCEMPSIPAAVVAWLAQLEGGAGPVIPRLVEPAAAFFTMCKITLDR